jgi:hypothetical protein
LYRLPEVPRASIVFVVEGEKDVETLRARGFVATTNVLEAASLFIDERLDLPEEARREIRLNNFQLCQEWCRVVARLDNIQNGMIERIEVRAGIPRRVVFESRLSQA